MGDTSPLASLTKLVDVDVAITAPTGISIPDAGLASAIRAALGLNPGAPITKDAMLTLTTLEAGFQGISDLTGLEHATNLEVLGLGGNQIVDVSVLSGLTNLTFLMLDDNDIVGVSPLEGLTNLTFLFLGGNEIVDVGPLSGLTSLTSLNLLNNKIVDVAPLAALVNLETLSLGGNPLGDTSPLASLTKLIDVDVEITDPRQREDVNGDEIVSILDLVKVGNAFGTAGPDDADVNGDGIVNIADLVLVGNVCCGAPPAAPLLHASVLDMFTAADVQAWLTQAQSLDATNPDFQNGIRFLEQLLAALTPNDTVLLANYPNPFNPETWIPYHLATPTDVQITIYDATGRVVRRLDLGHQSGGYYTEKSRAAYWDGKNALGESVASGIYFYQLQTDNASYLRKMLILK